jgi:non-ribosomal peptide synthetase component F
MAQIFPSRDQHSAEPGEAPSDRCPPLIPFIDLSRRDRENSIPGRFEKIVRLLPERLAVKEVDRSLTYDQLNRAANRIARTIRAERGDVCEPIALLFERPIDMIPAIIGVLKAGRFYVALDSASPILRTNAILEDAQVRLILSNRRTHVQEVRDRLAKETTANAAADNPLRNGFHF